jgi:hypothetical protein
MLKTVGYIFVFTFLFLLFPVKAHAYLDPGSGSYLVQIIVASLAGAGYFLKINWGKVKSILSKKKTQKSDEKGDN